MSDYNGWTNWETWQILLWASNEEDLYNEVIRFTECYPDANGLQCEAFFRDMFPCGTPDMDRAEDMDVVNWREIAQHLREWND
jgi:hypothetical protein